MPDNTPEIPQVNFNSEEQLNIGFEIVSIQRIAKNKEDYEVNPENVHQLKFYNLIVFTEGSGRHFVDLKWHSVKKNSLLYLSKEQLNAFEFSDNLKGYCIVFTEEYFIRCFSHLPNDFIYRLFNPSLFEPVLDIPAVSDFSQYLNLLLKEYEGKANVNKERILESLFIIMLSKAEQFQQNEIVASLDHSKTLLFQKFNSLLETNYSKSRIAEFYASEIGITYKHLNEICKKVVNKTAKQIIDDFIILQAKRRLINSDIKSTELAYQLGFEDPTNFTKYFKKNTGTTPKSFKSSFSIR